MRFRSRLRLLAPAVAVALVFVLPASSGGAATGSTTVRHCGHYRTATNIRGYHIGCRAAKRVVNLWLNVCNTRGLCAPGTDVNGEEWNMNGRKLGDILIVNCVGKETGRVVRFRAPA